MWKINFWSHGRCWLLWHHQDSHLLMNVGGSLSPKFSAKMRILMMLHRQSTAILLSHSFSLPLYILFDPDLLQDLKFLAVFFMLRSLSTQDMNGSTSFSFNR